jgi:hypothetical protein
MIAARPLPGLRSPDLRPLPALLLAILAGFLCASAGLAAEPADYDDAANWLCRPGGKDSCAVDLTTTVVAADGTLNREAWAADPNAPIDCFYVYPTVSRDTTPNSDLVAGPEEHSVIRSQFARFASTCRPFAPLYRQVTLTALRAGMSGQAMAVDRELGYSDVLAAWNHYLEHDNDGRGVVLIGHSQGSGVLTRLIAEQIDGKPIQDRIVLALLLGTSLPVPEGKPVGGAFQHMPLCQSAKQTGCVIAYASFRSTVPPPAASLFGRVRGGGEGMAAACVNPAALGGGSSELHAYLSAGGTGGSAADPGPWVTPAKAIDTPFVSVPGLLTGECVVRNGAHVLEVTVHGDAADPRVDDIVGDVLRDGVVQEGWGLHLIDVNLVMGDLVELVAQHARAWPSARTGASH